MFSKLKKKWEKFKAFFKDFFSEVEYTESELLVRKKWEKNKYGKECAKTIKGGYRKWD